MNPTDLTIIELAKIVVSNQAEIRELKSQLAKYQHQPTFLTYEQASQLTGLTVGTLRGKVSSGDWEPQRWMGRRPLFHRMYVNERMQGASHSRAMRALVAAGEILPNASKASS